MTYLIGTDEAGYGPNLGPLVISASVWQAPDGLEGDDLYRRLDAVIAAAPGRNSGAGPARVAIADSKVLYQSGKGLRLLERGLWAAWMLLDRPPRTCAQVWDSLTCQPPAARHAALCGGLDESSVPCDADQAELERLRPALLETLAQAGVRLVDMRSRAIFPEEFNRTVEQCGSKGAALSRWTLRLVSDMMAPRAAGRISIVCDKHGGRDRYLPLLMEFFPDEFIESHGEGRQRSVYRFGPPARRVEICFQAKGESHLPTALASMASKYLRELAMRAFCRFWCDRVPDLVPTAGYPQDARRFKAQIEAVQRELGIEDYVVWRVK